MVKFASQKTEIVLFLISQGICILMICEFDLSSSLSPLFISTPDCAANKDSLSIQPDNGPSHRAGKQDVSDQMVLCRVPQRAYCARHHNSVWWVLATR